MKKIGIATKVGMAFGLLVSVLLGVAWIGVSRVRRLNSELDDVIGKHWNKVQLSRQAMNYSNLNNRITMEVLILGDKEKVAPLLRERAENTEKITGLMNAIEKEGFESGRE